MKAMLLLMALMTFSSGCAWIRHSDDDGPNYGRGSISGPDYGPGRGTTGVSSGADAGSGITGSDAAPPK